MNNVTRNYAGRAAVMRYFTGLCAVVFLFCRVSALAAQENSVFAHPLNTETRGRFNAVCAGISAYPVVKGTFEQTKTIKRLGRSLVSRGGFVIASEQGMLWITKTPFPSTMAVGRDFIVQSTPGGARSKLDAKGNETFLSLADTLSSIFTGNAGTLTAKFDVYFSEQTSAGAAEWIIGLAPKESAVRSFAERITLAGTVAGGEALIHSMVIAEPSGDSVRYALANHRFAAALDADEKAAFSLE
jgi:hypothetical protein